MTIQCSYSGRVPSVTGKAPLKSDKLVEWCHFLCPAKSRRKIGMVRIWTRDRWDGHAVTRVTMETHSKACSNCQCFGHFFAQGEGDVAGPCYRPGGGEQDAVHCASLLTKERRRCGEIWLRGHFPAQALRFFDTFLHSKKTITYCKWLGGATAATRTDDSWHELHTQKLSAHACSLAPPTQACTPSWGGTRVGGLATQSSKSGALFSCLIYLNFTWKIATLYQAFASSCLLVPSSKSLLLVLHTQFVPCRCRYWKWDLFWFLFAQGKPSREVCYVAFRGRAWCRVSIQSHAFAETVRDCPQLFDGLRRYCLCPTAATKDTGD